jgi:sialate O-acetylesterase
MKTTTRRNASWLALGLAGACAAFPTQAAELAFAKVFGDHAVLQRDQPIAVWGTAAAGQTLTVSLDGKTARARADAQGRWRAELPKLAAGGPYTLSVMADGRTASVQDVLVGDVYLCSGQSNMEFTVRNATNAFGALTTPANPRLRFLNVQKNSTAAPQDELKGPAEWKIAGPDTVADASAVCYYMARSLQAKYGVPVGFINASWGGTTIQGWIGASSLRTLPAYTAGVDAVGELAAHPAQAMRHEEQRNEAWWTAHDPAAAAQRAYIAPDFDDAAWPTVAASGSWKGNGLAAFKDFDGVAWFRTSLDLSPEQAASANALQLGPIETYDTAWVNGVRVGGASTGWMWRDYPVPQGVFKPGRNVIVLRVLNNGNAGGPTGQPAGRGVRLADGKVVPLPATWKIQPGSRLKGLSVPPAPWDVPTSYTTLYNGMLAPLAGYKFKLAAWYQGESNTGNPDEYRTLLSLLMRDWRQRFGQAALPFLVVQLTSFGGVAKAPGKSDWAELRDAQAFAVKTDPHAALVVTLDFGDRSDIHPTQKTIVGERAARAARAVAYGEAIAPGGPQAVAARHEGSDIVVAFKDTNGALATYSSDKAIAFEVCAGDTCRYVDAVPAGDRVLLKGAWAPGVTRVRYAWANAPFVNLYGGDDLPAAPFQIDVRD